MDKRKERRQRTRESGEEHRQNGEEGRMLEQGPTTFHLSRLACSHVLFCVCSRKKKQDIDNALLLSLSLFPCILEPHLLCSFVQLVNLQCFFLVTVLISTLNSFLYCSIYLVPIVVVWAHFALRTEREKKRCSHLRIQPTLFSWCCPPNPLLFCCGNLCAYVMPCRAAPPIQYHFLPPLLSNRPSSGVPRAYIGGDNITPILKGERDKKRASRHNAKHGSCHYVSYYWVQNGAMIATIYRFPHFEFFPLSSHLLFYIMDLVASTINKYNTGLGKRPSNTP